MDPNPEAAQARVIKIDRGKTETRKGPTSKDVVPKVIHLNDYKKLVNRQPPVCVQRKDDKEPIPVPMSVKAKSFGESVTIVATTHSDSSKAANKVGVYRDVLNKFTMSLAKSTAPDTLLSDVTTTATKTQSATTAAHISSKLASIIDGTIQPGATGTSATNDVNRIAKMQPKITLPLAGGLQIKMVPKQANSLLNPVKAPGSHSVHEKAIHVKAVQKVPFERPKDSAPWVSSI